MHQIRVETTPKSTMGELVPVEYRTEVAHSEGCGVLIDSTKSPCTVRKPRWRCSSHGNMTRIRSGSTKTPRPSRAHRVEKEKGRSTPDLPHGLERATDTPVELFRLALY